MASGRCGRWPRRAVGLGGVLACARAAWRSTTGGLCATADWEGNDGAGRDDGVAQAICLLAYTHTHLLIGRDDAVAQAPGHRQAVGCMRGERVLLSGAGDRERLRQPVRLPP